MRKKIVLIDGHSILNRAFYGVPDLTTPKVCIRMLCTGF